MLHQVNRQRDREGRVVATLADYAVVRDLLADAIAASAEVAVPPSIRETVGAVKALATPGAGGVTVTAVSRHLQIDKSSASRRVKSAIDAGYLDNLAPSYRPACLVLTGIAVPANRTVLPTVADLEAALAGQAKASQP